MPDFGDGYLNVVHRVPLGVAGLITPWNHPLLITMKKLSAALAAGNSLVIKPSELGPAVPLALVGLLEDAGVPAGVVNVVTGLGATTGRALSEHQGLDKARHHRRDRDRPRRRRQRRPGADPGHRRTRRQGPGDRLRRRSTLEQAVAGAMFASFIATGQTCVQGARLLVQRTIYDAFVARLVERTSALRIGDPLSAATQVGPLVSRGPAGQGRHRRRPGDGNRVPRVLCGGRVPDGAEYREGLVLRADHRR